MTDAVTLGVDLGGGLRLRTPVLVASGTFGYGFDAPAADRASLGAIISKGTTPQARPGNGPVRIAEAPSGMLNAIGLQNPGVDHVVREYAPIWKTWDVPVIVNVAGDSIEDYATVARRLDGVAGSAGLSGPAIKPLALHAVWQLVEHLSIPVIGIGGIMTADDALEFLLAGAAAVQLGTVNYLRPQAASEVVEGIARYIEHRGYTRLSQLSLRPAKVMAGG